MAIGECYINGYCECYINGYCDCYINGYWWLLMVIILVAIDGYSIGGY
jgi:hypothetical protein